MKSTKKSIVTNIALGNSLIILLVFIAVFLLIGYISVRTSLNTEIKMMRNYLVNSSNVVDNQLKDMARVSLVAYSDERTQELIRNWTELDELERMESEAYLKKLFINMITIRNDIDGIYIFNNKSLIFKQDISGSSVRQGFSIDDAPWMFPADSGTVSTSSGYRLLINDEYGFIRKTYITNPFDKYSVYMLREIKSFSPNERIGFILLLSPINEIKETLENSLDAESDYFLLDEERQIICGRTGDSLGREISEIDPAIGEKLNSKSSFFFYKPTGNYSLFGSRRNIVSHRISEYSGLTLVIMKPLGVVLRGSILVLVATLGISLLAAAVAILLTDIYTKRMVAPLSTLSQAMIDFKIGNRAISLESADFETEQLITSFNKMAAAINKLIHEKYETTIKLQAVELEEHRTKLKYLRAQINPHFLNNTLDTIRMKAELNGDSVVASMIMLLVDFFRLSVNEDHHLIALEKEIKLADTYLKLMEHRYPNFESVIEVEKGMNHIEIPNFILQPLLENSLLHGLKAMNYKGRITIRAFRDKGASRDIRIVISDNGNGDIEQIKHYLRELPPEETVPGKEASVLYRVRHIGIQNIIRRLRLFYPEGYGLSYEKNSQGGVSAVLHLAETVCEDLPPLRSSNQPVDYTG